MSEFLTVKEAAQRVGKSPSSIRRLIYPIIEADDHPDRMHIRPTVEEVPQLRLKGENFAWRVSAEFLQKAVPPVEAGPEKGADRSGSAGVGESALTDMLRRELDIKNAQITQQGELIARQMDLINGLSERLREGNVLIGTLQQRLAPPKPVEEGIVESTPGKAAAEQKKSPSPKPAAAPKKRPRGRFLGLFGSRG